MIEGFYGEFRPSPLRRLHDHADNMVVLPRIVWLPSVSLIDLPVHPGSSSPMPSEVRVEPTGAAACPNVGNRGADGN